MKNITKKLIVVFGLVVVFGCSSAVFAAAPTVAVSGPTSPANTVTLNGAYSNATSGSTTTWFDIATSSANLASGNSQIVCQNVQSSSGQRISCPISVGQSYGSITIAASTTYYYQVSATNALGETAHSNPSSFAMGGVISTGGNTTNFIVSTSGPTSPANTVTLNGAYSNATSGSTTTWFDIATSSANLASGNSQIVCQNVQSSSGQRISCPISVGQSYGSITIAASTTYYYQVSATNGSGTTIHSNPSAFAMGTTGGACSATPTITSISPTSVNAGAGATTLTVNGTNFTSGTTTILFNNSNRTTTVTSSTVATASLTAADTASAGTETITVSNGTGCVSSGSTFTINTVNSGGGGGGGGYSYTYPTVTTVSATVNGTTGTFTGTINPNSNSYAATAWFEYATDYQTVSLGNGTPTQHNTESFGYTPINFTSENISFTPNTIYYFRAAANNPYGTAYGNILSFTTSASGTVNQSSVTTVIATEKTTTSARLNGVAVLQDGVTNNGYFEYGSTASMNNTTQNQVLGTTASIVNFSSLITGLKPDTIYYFRAVETNSNGVSKGNIFVFQTAGIGGITIDYTPTTPTNTVSTAQSSDILNITTSTDTVAVGDNVSYLVTYKDNTAKNFENTKIIIQLPKEVDFDNTNFGTVDSSNAVEFDPGTLVGEQIGSITIKGHIDTKALDQSVIVTTATMTYNVTGNTTEQDEIAYVANHIIAGNALSAASIFGDGAFLPHTLIEWLILILIVLCLLVLGKNLFASAQRNKNTTAVDNTGAEEL